MKRLADTALATLLGLAVAVAVLTGFAPAEPVGPTRMSAAAATATGSTSPAGSTKHAATAKDPLAHSRIHFLPPGSDVTPVPSEEIYPPQTIAIRFSHRTHVRKLEQPCEVCHGNAKRSKSAADRLLPQPADSCDHCHDVDHRDLRRVVAGPDPKGACTYCHLGQDAGVGGRVAKTVFPTANLHMNHAAHAARNIGCGQCHGEVEHFDEATREQLPRMAGCFGCHAQGEATRGDAKSACATCHLTTPRGTLETVFSTGQLRPPMWLNQAAHTPDWLARHKRVAAANSAMCGSCHETSECVACHDGRVRPRNVHPGDFITLHAQAARQDSPRCVSCHQLQSFCADCHRRVGVARDAPAAARRFARRFHPPPREWTDPPRSVRHHAFEAQRNLNACVSCHTERDCATCHATSGVRGGGGVNPHPLGFLGKCRTAWAQNPRPCLVCHEAQAPELAACQ